MQRPTAANVVDHSWGSRVADPKAGAGSFFPSLLERRRRIDQALSAVVNQAFVTGISVRKVDDLVKPRGADTAISKSELSGIGTELDTEVASFAYRHLPIKAFPYLLLDSTYCEARVGRGKVSRVVSQAVAVATGVRTDGCREALR